MAASVEGGGRGNVLRLAMWGAAGLLLLVPLVAMQMGAAGVNWTPGDFAAAGLMLGGACAALELAIRTRGAYRIAIVLMVGTTLFHVWVALAAGIGAEGNPGNLLSMAVVAVGVAGALFARFEAKGMARVALLMALAEAAVAAAALTFEFTQPDLQTTTRQWGEIVGLNGAFIVAFIVASVLFRKAAQEEAA